MSSHHIVRDEQEPALIIHDWKQFSYEKLGELLEWSPTVICCEPALEQVHSLGIKIDVIFAKKNQTVEDIVIGQSPVKLIQHKDESFLQSALEYLISTGHRAVNIITTKEKTEDCIKIGLAFAKSVNQTFWEQEYQTILIQHGIFRRWFGAGQSLRIKNLSTLEDVHFRDGDHATTIEPHNSIIWAKVEDGLIELQSDAAPFCVGLPF
jgi:thiamine pyrophosphokinase